MLSTVLRSARLSNASSFAVALSRVTPRSANGGSVFYSSPSMMSSTSSASQAGFFRGTHSRTTLTPMSNKHGRLATSVFTIPMASHQSHRSPSKVTIADGSETVEQERERIGDSAERITRVGLWVNAALSAFKLGAGVIGQSSAMIADALHSISDMVSDVFTIVFLRIARKPPDANHPFGHGKFESVGAMGVAAALVGTGGGIIWQNGEKLAALLGLIEATQGAVVVSTPTTIAFVAAIVSIVVKEALYQVTVKIGRNFNSNLVIANAWHHRSDAWSSIVALIGIGAAMAGFPAADVIGAMVVALMIVKIGVGIGRDSFRDLTDAAVAGERFDTIGRIIGQVSGVKSFHQLRMRRAGPYIFADVHIIVHPEISVSSAHQIADNVRARIVDKNHDIEEMLVHVDVEEDSENEERRDIRNNPLATRRSHEEIERDAQKIVSEIPQITGMTRVMCHFLNQQAQIDVTVTMDPSLSMQEASRVAFALRDRLLEIPDLDAANVHLQLVTDHTDHASTHQH